MKISIFGKNLEVSDYLRDMVEKKVTKLDRFFPKDTNAQVTLSLEHNRHIAEVTIPYEGGIIRADESTGDMYASIDGVIEKLERQVERYKTRMGRYHKAAPAAIEPEDADDIDEEDEPRIVRVKQFNIKPMDEEEAMLQIEMLGHSFYVFENANTGKINVLYKRKDGNYGLIGPEE